MAAGSPTRRDGGRSRNRRDGGIEFGVEIPRFPAGQHGQAIELLR